jgi:hypothetical protein
MSTVRALGVATLCVLLGACGYGGGRSFTPSDLPSIVLRPDEAPKGTRFAGISGPRTLAVFARDGAERDALRRDGFEGAYVVFFPPLSYFEHRPHRDSDVAFQAIAVVYERPDGAEASLDRYLADVRSRQMEGVSSATPAGLGDDATSLVGFAVADDSPLRVYAWRVDNLVLVLVASGPVDASEALALARTMNVRAAEPAERRSVGASG